MLKLFIGNKNYSSWSMRLWVLLEQAGLCCGSNLAVTGPAATS